MISKENFFLPLSTYHLPLLKKELTMPTYQYECQACGHAFEELQSMTDPKLTKCPKCKKNKLQRLIGLGGGIIFKGTGFYQTDYKNTSAPSSSPSSAPSAGGCGSGCGCHGPTKAEAKSEAKSSKGSKKKAEA